MPLATIGYNGKEFYVHCQSFDVERARMIPDRKFDKNAHVWRVPATMANVRYLIQNYKKEIGDADSTVLQKVTDMVAADNMKSSGGFPGWFEFKSPPRPYQMDALNKSWGMDEFALFMEMRTGKSFVAINLVAAYAQAGELNAMVVVLFPGAIKATWKIQLEEHMPIDYTCHLMQAGQKKKTEEFINAEDIGFKVLVIGIESLSAGSGPDLLTQFILKHNAMFLIDESTCIKNPKAQTKHRKRTRVKLCWDVGGIAKKRLILTGTPVTQGIEDLYSQFRFLNWQILGHKSYFSFQHQHCLMGGFEGRKIIGYRDVHQVIEAVSPYVYQISTEDAIGIPEEVLETIVVDPTPVQLKALKDLGDPFDMSTEMEGDVLEVETILERMTRYQQIVGGHFPYDLEGEKNHGIKPITGKNPKMEALIGAIDVLPTKDKVIVWARFVPELEEITRQLGSIYGHHEVITYRGGQTDEFREQAQRDFMETDGPRFWVASQQASARGVELASASIHVFFSNSFSYDDRKQASMRTSSSHQKAKSVLYIDIVMNHKIDKQIITALQRKRDMAEFVREEIKKGQGG